MKKSVPPAAIAVILVVAVALVVMLGYKAINGPDSNVTQSRIDMYKNMKGPIGAPGGNSAGGAAGNASGH